MSTSEALGSEHTIRLSSGPLVYRERGEGRPVVFVHGLLVNGDLWRKVVPDLAVGLRCITPDWPLGAHTQPLDPGADATVEGVAAQVAELLEGLDLRDVVLVGNDTGGAITQVVMTRYPERIGAVVLTPCDSFENFLPLLFRPLQWLARVPFVLTGVLQGLRLRVVRDSPVALGWLAKRPIDETVADSCVANLLGSRGVRRDVYSVLRSISPRITLEAAEAHQHFRAPVLLVWAREDRFFPPAHAEALAKCLPDARIEWVDDSYSFVPEDRPDALVTAMRSFLGVSGVSAA